MTPEAIHRCPLCEGELGRSGGKYTCWNSTCTFRSYRPWINPPHSKGSTQLADSEASIIGECLNATAFGPFFVDRGRSDNPYWEFSTLFGFERAEIAAIAEQWPDVDHQDPDIHELVGACITHLLGYPHRCELQWRDFISISPEDLSKFRRQWSDRYSGNCI